MSVDVWYATNVHRISRAILLKLWTPIDSIWRPFMNTYTTTEGTISLFSKSSTAKNSLNSKWRVCGLLVHQTWKSVVFTCEASYNTGCGNNPRTVDDLKEGNEQALFPVAPAGLRRAMNKLFAGYGARLRAENPISSKIRPVQNQIVITLRSTKRCGPRLVANRHNGNRCAACRQTQQSESKVMSPIS
jgi:hypothetical protein